MPAAEASESRTGPSRHRSPSGPAVRPPRTNSHKLSVVKHASGASGVAALPVMPVQRQVASTTPAQAATSERNKITAIRHVIRQVASVSRADPSRAPVSLGPATANPARCSQLTSAGFSTRRRPLKVGTIQSPLDHMASEQAAFRGSSSSHSGGPPRPGSNTTAASAATSSPWERLKVITWSWSGCRSGPRSGAARGRGRGGRVGAGRAAGQACSGRAETPVF